MKNMWKKTGIILAAVLIWVQCSVPAQAYFERGNVTVSVGKQSVTLEQGNSESVSVTLSPGSDRQLPGCGMAECPQSCGEKECLDENGECVCNGKTYKTYYAYASAASSNTSVATASYDNGVVTVKGVSAGTATITITASLRQYTSTSASIQVTVKSKPSSSGSNTGQNGSGSGSNTNQSSSGNGGGTNQSGSGSGSSTNQSGSESGNSTNQSGTGSGSNTGQSGSGSGSSTNQSGSGSGSSTNQSSSGNGSGTSGGNQASGNSRDSSGTGDSGITVKKVGDEPAGEQGNADENSGDPEETAEQTDDVTVIESDRGTIYFVPITAGKMGKEYLEKIMGQEAYVDFQMKDTAGTVLYAWEFYGKEIEKAEDIDYTIESSTNAFQGCSYATASDSLYLSFAHDGELPASASVFMKADSLFSDDQALNLYLYDDTADTVTLVQEKLTCENGYVTMKLEHCSKYILTAQTLESREADTEKTAKTEPEQTEKRVSAAGVTVVVIVVIAAAAGGAILVKKKKKGEAE